MRKLALSISIFFLSTSVFSLELDVPGPDLDLIKAQTDEAMKIGDESEYLKQLSMLGLHCGSIYLLEGIMKGFGSSSEYLSKIEEFTTHSMALASATLNQDYMIEKMKSDSLVIRKWYLDHIKEGSDGIAGRLLGYEMKQCTQMITGLKENIEDMLRHNP